MSCKWLTLLPSYSRILHLLIYATISNMYATVTYTFAHEQDHCCPFCNVLYILQSTKQIISEVQMKSSENVLGIFLLNQYLITLSIFCVLYSDTSMPFISITLRGSLRMLVKSVWIIPIFTVWYVQTSS